MRLFRPACTPVHRGARVRAAQSQSQVTRVLATAHLRARGGDRQREHEHLHFSLDTQSSFHTSVDTSSRGVLN
jgi:hypothetical protein